MALTSEQKSSRLFKKGFGLAETITARDFFEEAYVGPSLVMPSQIWTEADKIPSTAPSLSDGEISGVIQYYDKLELTHIPGSTDRAYYDERLKDALDFTIDATYNYELYENDGTTPIADGQGDWLVDREAGVLSFYGTLPSISAASPPMISFYKYVGEKGLQISGATSGINVKDPVVAATIEELSGATYSNTISGYTTLPTDIDGVTSFNEGDRFLVKNQIDERQNGIFQVSGTTLVRAADHDGNPFGEVGVNDYTFVTSGTTLIATAWVLGSTDASDVNHIVPGVDTQIWKFFSESKAYVASGTGIKLQNGNTFYLDLDEGGVHGSGLEQSVDGVRVKASILTDIETNASGVTSLSTALSSETSERVSADSSLSTLISSNTSDNVSLSTALSSETSERVSVDNSLSTLISSSNSGVVSLSTALSSETSERVSADSSLSTLVSSNASDNVSLSTALSSETSERVSGDNSLSTLVSSNTSGNVSLSTALSAETSERISADSSLSTLIQTNEVQPGDGLSKSGVTMNVNVDDFTIKIISDELRGQQTWIQNSTSVTVSGGTSGLTGIQLDFDPVTPVFAYVNGIEYLISPSTAGQVNFPFYYSAYPPVTGTEIGFDASIAGFDLESGVDMVTVKFSYIDETP